MELNNDLITQFAKITKFNTSKSATTVRGTISKTDEDDRTYLHIDGAEEGSKTPVETVVEVSDGDRVIATMKDHSVVVTGNKTNPSIGIKTRDGLRSEIKQEADSIKMNVSDRINGLESFYIQEAGSFKQGVTDEVNRLSSVYEQTASGIISRVEKLENASNSGNEFTEFKQTVEGFFFTDEDGTVYIDGGSVYAKNLNLTGAITWGDLDETTKDNIDGAASDAASSAISGLEEDIEDAKANAKKALDMAEAVELPDYIKETYIDSTTIESPEIVGGTFYAVGSDPRYDSTFTTMDENGFYLYSNATIADTDNAIYPKISMMCSDTMNGRPMIILGAGESDDDIYHNRFIIEKSASHVWLDYHFDYSYPGCGITFSRDGTITINGTLAGETGLFPIGYIYISTDTTSPASLFGGSWTRLSGYFLYATGSDSKVDTTVSGGVVTAGGTNSAAYINIAAWERVG